ncbi:MAG: DUF4199 domain-containing protein [Bacteroidales bacterium]|nr:DUF4199 domain-containing protein [Bacteroidales bacterium]MBN2820108.1 DUF4199 domain-containing protein [Bacteroidales bacterium]
MNEKKIWLKHILNHGLILGITLSVIEFTALFLGMLFRPVMPNIYMVLVVFLVYTSIRKYREVYLGGFISFKDAFLTGFLTCMLSGAIWAIYRYIEYSLSPNIVQEIIATTIEPFQESAMDTDTKELFISITKTFTSAASLSLINTFLYSMTFGGALLSVFLGFILKRNSIPSKTN